MDSSTGSSSPTRESPSRRGSRRNLLSRESARDTFIPQSQSRFFNQSQSFEARQDDRVPIQSERAAVTQSQTVVRNLDSRGSQEMFSRTSTAAGQEPSRPSTASVQKMSSRPGSAVSREKRPINPHEKLEALVLPAIKDRSMPNEIRDSIATVTSRDPPASIKIRRQPANKVPCEEKSEEHSPTTEPIEAETVPVTVETVPAYCREEAAARFQLLSKATSKELYRNAASSAWEKSSNQGKFIQLISAKVTATPQVFHQLQAPQFLYSDVQHLDIAQEALDKLNSFRMLSHALGVQE